MSFYDIHCPWCGHTFYNEQGFALIINIADLPILCVLCKQWFKMSIRLEAQRGSLFVNGFNNRQRVLNKYYTYKCIRLTKKRIKRNTPKV